MTTLVSPGSATGRTGPAPVTPAVAAAAAPGDPAPASHGLRAALRRTPGKLRVAGVLVVVAALVAGAAGLAAGLAQAAALDAARADTAQLIGVREVRNDLVTADAAATNAFLVGGLEPVEQRVRYSTAIAEASQGLAGLAGSNSSDADLLGTATAGLTTYTGLVEQARANNRQGFPVGAAYLDQASSVLRSEVLPALDGLVADNEHRVDGSFAAVSQVLWVLALCVLALVVLVVVQVWLARRTHRRLNAGLVVATVVLVVATVGGAVVLGRAGVRADDVRDGPYARAVAVSQALSLATDAKSMESFTLIKRGSGQAFEETFVAETDQAAQVLDGAPAPAGDLGQQLATWVGAHAQIRALDDAGDWDGAVALAVDPQGEPRIAFDALTAAATSSVDEDVTATQDALGDAGGAVVLLGWLALLAGVAAAVLGWRGIGRRLEEYR
ncbi:hypothetical protein Cch01nite_38330 [Cellulomonas chitinilytica]|uniref:Secreted protein n=1 Tax=Cellulomonas chitinilytica TaxID=398759 RepID=A0A919U4G1_9CELL|nr:hypothetical protein [Cellulomonas chitinilytica]GIG23109.1 hypothetical protein Cch01nite_38330 [Cellulomonas chitinilytica]